MRKILMLSILLVMPLFCFAQEVGIQKNEKDAIKDILLKMKNIGSVRYTAVETYSTQESTKEPKSSSIARKVFGKQPFWKIETKSQFGNSETIIRPEGSYLGASNDNNPKQYLKMPSSREAITFAELAEQIESSQTVKLLGTEIVDGQEAIVVKIDIKPTQPVSIEKKIWIWKESGIPARIEFKSRYKDVLTILRIENKDFVFGDIPDSIFEIPKDQIKDLLPSSK